MLKTVLELHIIFYIIGILIGIGVISKAMVQIQLRRLVKEAGSMNKSTHSLMRLVRAKFEHNCMISDKVENVGAFVDKYLYEYQVCGLRFHVWRRLELQMIWLCGTFGAIGAALSYSFDGMNDYVLWYGAFGAAGMIVLFLIHNFTDEKYQLNAVHTYMVDYLENICAHRFAKAYQKDKQPIQVMVQPQASAEDEEDYEEADLEELDYEEAEPEPAAYLQAEEDKPEEKENITEIEPDIKIMPEPVTEPDIDMPEPVGEPERPQTDPVTDPQVAPTGEPVLQADMIRGILEEFLA